MSKHRSGHLPGAHVMAAVLTAAVLLAMVGGVVLFWPPDSPASAASQSIPPREGPGPLQGFDRLVFYGHSMPTGGGASSPATGYAEVAAELAGVQLVNLAEGGTVATTAANTMESLPSPGARDAVIIHTGMNDIFRRGDDAAELGREGIRRLLAGSDGAKRRVLVLECQPSSWMDTPPQRDLQAPYDAWNDMLREEAAAAGDVAVLDACATWDPADFTDSPKYHPNDAGHALIAEEIVELLAEG